MSLRFFYQDTIEQFLNTPLETIIGKLSDAHSHNFDLTGTQTQAWKEQIVLLQSILVPYKNRGCIFFEYSIPRMGRRIDTVLLIDGIVFILEFKVYCQQFEKADIAQVWDLSLIHI